MGTEKNAKRKSPQGEVARRGQRIIDPMGAPRKSASAIDVKQAVAKAMEYFKELVPNSMNVALEEVERSGSDWLITLGYNDKFANAFVALRGDGRSYKVITIDAETGAAVSMKIRKP